MRRLFAYLKKEVFPIIVIILLSIASVVLTVYATTFLRTLTNEISAAAKAAKESLQPMSELLNMRSISENCFILVGMYVGSVACNYIQAFLLSGVIQRVSFRLRKEISAKINRLPLSYFDGRQIGDTMSRVTNDVDTVAQSLNSAISTTVSSVVQLIFVGIMMFVTSWEMGLTAVATVPLSVIFALLIMKTTQKYFRRQQTVLGELNGKAEETYAGMITIKAFGKEEKFVSEFEETNSKLQKAMYKANTLSGLTYPLSGFINKLGYVAVCVIGGILVAKGSVDLGAIAAFFIYINLFQQSISSLSQTANVYQQASAASARVFEFLNEEEQAEEADKKSYLTPKEIKGEVEFRNVSFGYTPEKSVLKNFNAVIKPGQKVAIVGPTGAGKTTIVNLLMRFYEIDGGEILIDGISTRELKRENVRELFSMVLQDTWLFEGSVKENISYTVNASDEEIVKAIEAARLTYFVNSLPLGLNAPLNGEELSGGQKQLITIARAMLVNSPMMILDEATSNVDTETEEAIQAAMDALTKGRTSFVIAHRLSTIKNADLILVLKDGDVIEQGTHTELLKTNGYYAQLYNSQFA